MVRRLRQHSAHALECGHIAGVRCGRIREGIGGGPLAGFQTLKMCPLQIARLIFSYRGGSGERESLRKLAEWPG